MNNHYNSVSSKANFVVIGPGKCGTSWIFNILKNHPEVCVSSSKETLYFERYIHKSEDWYHEFFAHKKSNQITGEISNTYVFDPKVPKRIADYNKDIKLISTLRNPIDRTFSHYLYMLKVGEEKGTFDEVLKKRPDLIYRGKYSELLSAYDKHFTKDQILVLLFEDLKTNNRAYANQLFGFLEIEKDISQKLLDEKVLSASKARNQFIASTVTKLAHLARDLGFAELVTKVKFNKKLTRFFYSEFKSGQKPKLNLEHRNMLMNIFYNDVEKLSFRLNKDMIKYWNFS